MAIVGTKLHKSFRSRRGTVLAVRDIDLHVSDHEFVSLVGPSGCGKTTLLRMIAGLTPYDSGELSINGRPVSGPGPDRAMVFQNAGLLPWDTILTNVAFGLELKRTPKEERQERARRLMELVGLKGFEDAYPYQLSGGMRQRAGLARALAVEPEVLLMDEPFGAVDALTRQVLQDELLRLWEHNRLMVVFVTHSIEEAVLLSDRVAVLSDRPSRVLEWVTVDIPRPRDLNKVRQLPQFSALSAHIWELLSSAGAAGRREQ